MGTKERYQGIQTVFKKANSDSCLFLCLLSIAEDYLKKPVDFIQAYRDAIDNKFINDNFYCYQQENILTMLTGKKWKKEIREKLPSPVPEEMYTVEKWYNRKTGYTHFKRRGFDSLVSSRTVLEGKLQSYYCYVVED